MNKRQKKKFIRKGYLKKYHHNFTAYERQRHLANIWLKGIADPLSKKTAILHYRGVDNHLWQKY